jgi:hypothetical protein
MNHDGEIDIRDLTAIFDSLGKHVSATDPRDATAICAWMCLIC